MSNLTKPFAVNFYFFTIFNLIGLISDLVESLDEGIFSILI